MKLTIFVQQQGSFNHLRPDDEPGELEYAWWLGKQSLGVSNFQCHVVRCASEHKLPSQGHQRLYDHVWKCFLCPLQSATRMKGETQRLFVSGASSSLCCSVTADKPLFCVLSNLNASAQFSRI